MDDIILNIWKTNIVCFSSEMFIVKQVWVWWGEVKNGLNDNIIDISC